MKPAKQPPIVESGYIIEQLNKILTRLNDLADEEENVFNSHNVASQETVRGHDSKEAYEAMNDATDAISKGIEMLRGLEKSAPHFRKPAADDSRLSLDIARFAKHLRGTRKADAQWAQPQRC